MKATRASEAKKGTYRGTMRMDSSVIEIAGLKLLAVNRVIAPLLLPLRLCFFGGGAEEILFFFFRSDKSFYFACLCSTATFPRYLWEMTSRSGDQCAGSCPAAGIFLRVGSAPRTHSSTYGTGTIARYEGGGVFRFCEIAFGVPIL